MLLHIIKRISRSKTQYKMHPSIANKSILVFTLTLLTKSILVITLEIKQNIVV